MAAIDSMGVAHAGRGELTEKDDATVQWEP